jgi:hypothetical protein
MKRIYFPALFILLFLHLREMLPVVGRCFLIDQLKQLIKTRQVIVAAVIATVRHGVILVLQQFAGMPYPYFI